MVFFMKRFTSKTPVIEKEKGGCLGLTLRQWTLLDSMLIFTITAVITMCSILGYIHSKEVISILNDDIREELTESQGYYNPQSHGNHAILYLSVDKVLITNRIMTVCMWASLLNLFCAALLMYGVSMKSSKFMIPWLIVSVTCYISSFALQIVGHYNAIPNVYITWKILVLSAFCGSLFGITWYCVYNYYCELVLETPPPPTVYETKEGYRHTVSSNQRLIRNA